MQPPAMLDGVSTYVPTPENVAATAAPPHNSTHVWKDGESFSFHDLLDTINPLQHIPIISSIYRWITGDTPGNVAEMVGDGIYGGPLGLAAGLANIAFKEENGQSPGEMAIALVTGSDTGTKVAAAPTAAADAAPASAGGQAQTQAPSPAAVATSAPATADASAPTTPFAGIPLVAAGASRPPIPLQRSAAQPLPLPGSPGSPSPAEQAFLNRKAALQRNLYGARPVLADHPTTAPIPLHLTGPALPQRAPRPVIVPGAGTIQPAAVSTALPPAVPAAALPDNPPVDISQRMMDALDKYARMQQDRPRGQSVDVSP